MSEPNNCTKCGEKIYDEEYSIDPGYYCETCVRNIMKRFNAFFGVEVSTYNTLDMGIMWKDVIKILDSIQVDPIRIASIVVPDVLFYRRTVEVETPVTEG